MTRVFVQDLGGRKTSSRNAFVRVEGGHHEGMNHFAPGCKLNPPLPGHCRIVCIDTKKFHWCSIESAASHSFALPQNGGKAKGIVRTFFANHCDWADVLIDRGRCFGHHKSCFRAKRALENSLWNRSKMRRPYVVYQDRSAETPSGCDPVPGWLTQECVYKNLCQCHLVGTHYQGWCRAGSLYSNVVCRRFQLFEGRSDCTGGMVEYDRLPWNYLNRNAKNREIATGLSWIVMHVLRDTPPSVPPRGESMVCALTCRKRKPKCERSRRDGIMRRLDEGITRRYFKYQERMRRAEESDNEEAYEEESIP